MKFSRVIVMVLGVFGLPIVAVSCKDQSRAGEGAALPRLKAVAQDTGFRILSLTGPGDSLLIPNHSLNQIAEDLRNKKNMQLVISPYHIDKNGMMDLTISKCYLIYEGRGWYDAVKVWPIGNQ